jgi:hypothetical protein
MGSSRGPVRVMPRRRTLSGKGGPRAWDRQRSPVSWGWPAAASIGCVGNADVMRDIAPDPSSGPSVGLRKLLVLQHFAKPLAHPPGGSLRPSL